MKKLLLVILSVIACLCLAVGFVGCGDRGNSNDDKGSQEHVHTFAETWTANDDYHWKKATCGHSDEVSEKGTHTIVDGECTVCGRAFAKIDITKILKAFITNAYTTNVTINDDTVEVSQSLKDLFVKVRVGDNKALVDKTGIYFKDEDELHYASIRATLENMFFHMKDVPFAEFIEKVSEYIPEGWTVDDLIAIIYDGEEFKFDKDKAIALLETLLFNENITLNTVTDKAQDGFTYEEIAEILKPEIIAFINNALPEGMTIENIMPMLANVTPANITALFDAFGAGELNADVINALLPQGMTVEFVDTMIANLYPELNITVAGVLEKVNAVIKYLNSIDFEAIADAISQEQIRTLNKVIRLFFIEEEVATGVKYTLNYGAIKTINDYLNDTTLETIINTVIEEGFVEKASNYGVYLLDSKLSALKVMLEGYIGITLEEILDKIDEYAAEYAPTINTIISGLSEQEIDVLSYVNLATTVVRSYLANEELMDKTLGETIEMFAGEQGVTAEMIKGYIDMAVSFLKTNTVYDVLALSDNIDKAQLYARINGVADMLTANFPLYLVIDADGELEELSAEAVIVDEYNDDDENISVFVKKGDLLGNIFTEAKKAEMVGALTEYTVADFTGYQYAYYHEYNNDGYYSIEVKVIVTVEENEGTYVINREYNYGNYYTIRHSYYFDNADLSDALITINEDGTIRYDIIRYCYVKESNKNGESGYMEYREISLVFGDDISWLGEDKYHIGDFVALPDAEAVA